MKSVYLLIALALFLFSNPRAHAEAPDYVQVVSQKLAPVLQKCVNHIEAKMPELKGQDSFTFKILPNGQAQNFKYTSENKIPKKWLSCAEKEILKTKFPKTPDRKTYVHHGVMTWNMTVEEVNPFHKVMNEHMTDFQSCYGDYVKSGGKNGGSVVLVWQVNSQNRASFAKLNVDEIKDKKFSECLIGALNNLVFPTTDRNLENEISFPIQFSQKRSN